MKKNFSILTLIAVTFIVVLIFSGCDKESIEAVETTTTPIEESTTIIANEQRIFEEETIQTTQATAKKTTTTQSPTTPTQKTTVAAVNTDKRQPTGEGKKLTFNKGDNVLGAWIEINGKGFSGLIKNAPMAGIVTSGVVNPWEKEMIGMKIISNDKILSSSTTQATNTTPTTQATTTPPTTSQTRRVTTGVGQSKAFQVGDTVVGWSVTINGKTVEGQLVLYNSPVAGIVTDGVINPWSSEITNQRVITLSDFS